jgi:hypothetical protein
VEDDGDIRYRPDIQGYSRDVRKRVRDTEHQVNLLVTARIRDTSTAAQELLPATMSDRVREIVQVTRGVRARQIKPSELRAALVSLAATATICAEAADRPRSLGGSPDAQAGLKPLQATNVVPIRRRKPTAAPKTAKPKKKDKTVPGQLNLWDVA